MLSDEEKKALEKIDYIQDFIIENGQYNADVNDMEYFSKVLNLIEKKSKEIEELKDKAKELIFEKQELTTAILDSTPNDYIDKHYVPIERYCQLEKEMEELKKYEEGYKLLSYSLDNYISKDKLKAKIEEYKKQIEKMEKDDIGRGFTLGKEWSDLKAKVEFGQSLLEKE